MQLGPNGQGPGKPGLALFGLTGALIIVAGTGADDMGQYLTNLAVLSVIGVPMFVLVYLFWKSRR